jgi:apolipoprotein N-acyltransferase
MPLAVGTGVVMALGMAPYDLWYLAFAGLIAAFWLFMAAPRGLYAIGTGWAIGLGYFGFSLGWIVEPFMVDVATTGWMAPFALLGMAGGLALFWAMAFWMAAHAPTRLRMALVIAWSGAELARAFVFTGFPWALISYLWLPVAPIQWVSLIGPHGLNLLTLAIAALFARAIPRNSGIRLLPAVLGTSALLSLFVVGFALTAPPADLSNRPIVRLIQPNAAQHQKWDPDLIPMFFQRQLNLTEAPAKSGQPDPALIVWPETSVPNLLHRSGTELGLIAHAAGPAQVVIGIQRFDGRDYFNSLAHLGADGTLKAVYDKHHLVPFGEYMPAEALFRRWNILGLASRAEGGYAPGPGPEIMHLQGIGAAVPLICYEAVFPQDVRGAPGRADLLMQITNDAWFGEWSGPYQHLAQARMRAIEMGLPMLRAANTGVSAVIDGSGRIINQLSLGQSGFIDTPLPPPLPETIYAKIGDLPVVGLLFLSILGLIVSARIKRVDAPARTT